MRSKRTFLCIFFFIILSKLCSKEKKNNNENNNSKILIKNTHLLIVICQDLKIIKQKVQNGCSDIGRSQLPIF